MGSPLTLLAGVSTLFGPGMAASAGVPAVGAVESFKAGKEADALAKENEKKQRSLLSAAEARAAQEQNDSAAAQARATAIAKQKASQFESGGRKGTLVSGPLGVVSPPATSGKTLLGM